MKTGKKAVSLILSLVFVLCTIAVGGVTSYAVDGSSSEAKIRAINCDSEITLRYKESKTYEFEAENLPEGAAVHVFCNGEDKGACTYYTVEKPTDDYTVEGKILDRDGTVIAASGEIKVAVQHSFSDRAKDFFKNTFGTFFDAIADIFSAIFMRIWIFLHR